MKILVSDKRGTAHPIRYVGDPVLHHPCAEVTDFDDELDQLIEDMFASMYAAEGVGLAANQIGVPLRVFVYDCPDGDDENQLGHVVNPVLVDVPLVESELVDHDEGCLSVLGQRANLGRPFRAVVRGADKTGAPIEVEGTGILARCFHHETDHLNGRLYIDRLPAEQRAELIAAANAEVANRNGLVSS